MVSAAGTRACADDAGLALIPLFYSSSFSVTIVESGADDVLIALTQNLFMNK